MSRARIISTLPRSHVLSCVASIPMYSHISRFHRISKMTSSNPPTPLESVFCTISAIVSHLFLSLLLIEFCHTASPLAARSLILFHTRLHPLSSATSPSDSILSHSHASLPSSACPPRDSHVRLFFLSLFLLFILRFFIFSIFYTMNYRRIQFLWIKAAMICYRRVCNTDKQMNID